MANNMKINRANVDEVHVNKVVYRGGRRRAGSGGPYVTVRTFHAFRRWVVSQLVAVGRALRSLRSLYAGLNARTASLEQQVAELAGSDTATQQFFRNRINTVISVTTDAGIVTGTIRFVGTDFIELEESDGDLVSIPLVEINSVTT